MLSNTARTTRSRTSRSSKNSPKPPTSSIASGMNESVAKNAICAASRCPRSSTISLHARHSVSSARSTSTSIRRMCTRPAYDPRFALRREYLWVHPTSRTAMSTKMQDLLARAHAELRYQPVEKRVRANIGADAASTAGERSSSGSRAASSPPTPCPSRTSGPSCSRRPRRTVTRPACCTPASRSACTPPTAGPSRSRTGSAPGTGSRTRTWPATSSSTWHGFDAWYEEDEPIVGHPRDPYHRVDVRLSRRPLRIEVDGDVVAETTRARVLFETQLTRRFYVPREDVRAELHPTDTRTYCPYKGAASYWTVDAGGRLRKDLGWTYEEPLPDAVVIAGLVAFWTERDRRLHRRRAAGPPRRSDRGGDARGVRRRVSGFSRGRSSGRSRPCSRPRPRGRRGPASHRRCAGHRAVIGVPASLRY